MRKQTREIVSAAIPLVVVVGIGGAACGRGDDEKTEKQCFSPAAVSGLYAGDRSEGVTNKQATWRLGVVIVDKTVIRQPQTYRGMVIGFGPTASNTERLDELPPVGHPFGDRRLSKPVSPQYKKFVVKIGPGNVTFTARMQAEAGSPDCSERPDVSFSEPTPLDKILSPSLPPNEARPIAPDWP